MFRVFVLFALFTIIMSQGVPKEGPIFEEYQRFLKRYNKTYSNLGEMERRYNVFSANFNHTKKNSTFGVTKFSDMTQEEFKKKYLKFNTTNLAALNSTKKWYNETQIAERKKGLRFLQEEGVPATWDWRDQGVVNEIQNQGSCGGCWAFATIANLEGVYAKKNGYLPKYSEQQLIDCDPYNTGCDGGIMGSAYDYLKTSGIQSEVSYPYIEATNFCSYDPSQANAIVADYISAGTTDEEYIKEMLYTNGPLAITINANTLQYYTGGVLSISYDECPYAPSHGVNLVGYGTDEYGVDFWIVRNTWGPDWGENGYFRLARGYGLCGVNMYVVSAVLN